MRVMMICDIFVRSMTFMLTSISNCFCGIFVRPMFSILSKMLSWGFSFFIYGMFLSPFHVFDIFRTLEDVIYKNRISTRLWSYPLHIMNYTNKLVLILPMVFYCMDPLALVKQCLPKLLWIIPLLPSSGLWDLSLCRSMLVRYDFYIICIWMRCWQCCSLLCYLCFFLKIMGFQFIITDAIHIQYQNWDWIFYWDFIGVLFQVNDFD